MQFFYDDVIYDDTFVDRQLSVQDYCDFCRLNNLVLLGLDKFYVTNFLTMQSNILKQLEMFAFFLPLQNVVYFDGTKGTVVLTGTYGGNGIDISRDKK